MDDIDGQPRTKADVGADELSTGKALYGAAHRSGRRPAGPVERSGFGARDRLAQGVVRLHALGDSAVTCSVVRRPLVHSVRSTMIR